MDGTGEDESGGGVMILFTSDPARQWEVLDAIKYATKALKAQQLIVTEHDADSKKMQPRYAYARGRMGGGAVYRVFECKELPQLDRREREREGERRCARGNSDMKCFAYFSLKILHGWHDGMIDINTWYD